MSARTIATLIAVGLAPAALGCPGYLDPSFSYRTDVVTGARPPATADGPAAAPDLPPPPPVLRDAALAQVYLDARPAPPDASPASVDASPVYPDASPTSAACAEPAAIQMFLTQSCNLCHGTVMKAGMLDLEAPGVKGRLLDQPSKICPGKTLAVSDGTGFFIDKLTGPIPGSCGMPMPFFGMPATAEQVACLRAWLRQK
jgi:hypothetical protein